MGYKVLLADDSITIQKVIGIIFANEDYDLTVVDNGNVALEKAKEILPDVILVDALMPGKSGYEVCREVRRDNDLKDIPLLLLVGAFEPFDEEKARNSGADDHISKPFESQYLIEKVKKLIEIGVERAKSRVQEGIATHEEAPSGILSLGGEAVQATEAAPALSAAITDGGAIGEKPAEVLYFDSLEMVEAAPEDDLWGVFELEEAAEVEDVQLGEIIDEEELQPEMIDSVEEIEPFVFREDEPVPAGSGTNISLGEYPEPSTVPMNETDEVFVLKEEPVSEGFGGFAPAPEPSVEIAEVAGPVHGEYMEGAGPQIPGFAEIPPADLNVISVAPSHETAFPKADLDLQFAPQEEYVPAPCISALEEDTRPAGVSETAGTDTISLSEEQLSGILSKISREIIEKIAWEVVPDLAETIIREEIRKIKEGY